MSVTNVADFAPRAEVSRKEYKLYEHSDFDDRLLAPSTLRSYNDRAFLLSHRNIAIYLFEQPEVTTMIRRHALTNSCVNPLIRPLSCEISGAGSHGDRSAGLTLDSKIFDDC